MRDFAANLAFAASVSAALEITGAVGLPAQPVDLSALNHQDLGLIHFKTSDAVSFMRNRRATGADVRRVRDSIAKLIVTIATIEGFDGWTSERTVGLVDHMPLIISYTVPQDMSLPIITASGLRLGLLAAWPLATAPVITYRRAGVLRGALGG